MTSTQTRTQPYAWNSFYFLSAQKQERLVTLSIHTIAGQAEVSRVVSKAAARLRQRRQMIVFGDLIFDLGHRKNCAVVLLEQNQNISRAKFRKSQSMTRRNGTFTWWKDVEQVTERTRPGKRQQESFRNRLRSKFGEIRHGKRQHILKNYMFIQKQKKKHTPKKPFLQCHRVLLDDVVLSSKFGLFFGRSNHRVLV